ncbi:hypothetical protein EMCRGX_G034328 [Ephydatia muelleri]
MITILEDDIEQDHDEKDADENYDDSIELSDGLKEQHDGHLANVMAEAIKSEIKSEALLPNSNGVLLETTTSQNSNGPNLPKLTLPLTPTVLSPARRVSLQSRQRPERKPMVLNLSMTSWIFLVLAFIQVFLISGLQIAIAVLGKFRTTTGLSEYDSCLNTDVQKAIKCAVEANQTVSIPSFGRDKEIYIYLFLFLTLKTQNYIELIAFGIINLVTMGYAALQVWQFRGYGGSCPLITNIGYMALTSVMVFFVFTVVFTTLSVFLFFEFGWKVYKSVGCNSELIGCYEAYKVFVSAVKILILFTVVFSIAQVVLLLSTSDSEFGLSIVLAVAAILSYWVINAIVCREWLAGYFLLLVFGAIVVPAYYIYEVKRFATRQCPTCIRRDVELKMEKERIINLLNNLTDLSDPNCINITLLNETMFPDDRSLELQNLVIVALVNLVTSLVVLLVFVILWKQRGKGLKELFKNEMIQFSKFSKDHVKEERDAIAERVKAFRWSIKGRKKKSMCHHSRSIQVPLSIGGSSEHSRVRGTTNAHQEERSILLASTLSHTTFRPLSLGDQLGTRVKKICDG